MKYSLLILALCVFISFSAQPKIGTKTVIQANGGTSTNLTETSTLTVTGSGDPAISVTGNISVSGTNSSGYIVVTNNFVSGSGSVVTGYYRTPAITLFQVSNGTSSSPDTSTNPMAKFSRILEMPAGGFIGDGSDLANAVSGIAYGTINNQVQVIGLHGFGETVATNTTSGYGDAVGGYFVGNVKGSAPGGAGIGMFANGRREGATGRAVGMELSVDNETTTSEDYTTPTGLPKTRAGWIHATGQTNVAVGLLFGNPFGPNFDVGVAFNAQVAGGQTGPARTADIRTDDTSSSVLVVNGTHTNGAIVIGASSGGVAIGQTNAPSNSQLTVMGTTTDSTAYQFLGKASNGNQTTTINNQGRLDLTRYTGDGGIVSVHNGVSPANNLRGGHYDINARDGSASGLDQTISLYESVVTTTNVSAMNSYARVGYMEDLDVSAGQGQQPNKFIKISKAGMEIPPVLQLGTNFATAGQIRLPNNGQIVSRNAGNSADLEIAKIDASDVLELGGAGTTIRFYSGSAAKIDFGASAANPISDNAMALGANAGRWTRVYAYTFIASTITPAQITSNQNDYAPSAGGIQRWSSDAARDVTGMNMINLSGTQVTVVNVGSQTITLKNENASSTSTNRFHNTTGADIVLSADQQAMLWYDVTISRWRVSKMN